MIKNLKYGISKISRTTLQYKGSMNNNFDIRVKEFKLAAGYLWVVIYVESQ